jgi:hypothetical protein
MNTFRDITETFIPGAMGFGVITIGDLNALASLLVALVSIGAGAALVLSSFVGLAGLAAGANWTVFLVTFGTAAATHFGAWMKQHPIEDIE